MTLTLFGYWRAAAPYRVRIGLNLKGLAYDQAPVNLLKGEQRQGAYLDLNPQGLTPALAIGDGVVLTQSLAILEWLDETHPEPALLPADPLGRARVRAMAQVVACDIHPLNNVRVTGELAARGQDEAARRAWMARWLAEGFTALEAAIAAHGGTYAHGDTPTLADICIVPQVYGARRFDIDLSPYPTLVAAADRAADHPAFAAAHPSLQPDAADA
ncbi:maleylacetoacetate isomerase [Caulobacter sp. CCNWLY153]|uniref:maleylacetoacetate isomerase n=1 Tax=unclassified Caulobacter TaxID=2648921 RepID=UPI002FF2CD3F